MRLVSRMCFELQGQSPCCGVRVQVQAFLSMSCVWRVCVGHQFKSAGPQPCCCTSSAAAACPRGLQVRDAARATLLPIIKHVNPTAGTTLMPPALCHHPCKPPGQQPHVVAAAAAHQLRVPTQAAAARTSSACSTSGRQRQRSSTCRAASKEVRVCVRGWVGGGRRAQSSSCCKHARTRACMGAPTPARAHTLNHPSACVH